MAVCDELDLDVPRFLNVLLDEQPVRAEGRPRLLLGQPEAEPHLLVVPGDAHALAAAAGGGLDHDGVADVPRDAHGVLLSRHLPDEARNRVDARLGRQPLRVDLVPERIHGVRVGADECDAGALQLADEARVLAKEAAARVHRLRAGPRDRVHDARDAEVRLRRRRGADADGLEGRR